MADEPYDMLPHKEIVNLKKQLKELREKKDKSFSNELTNSMNDVKKSMDSMLKLFTEAAELKEDNQSTASLNEKLDKIIEQNKIIAEGMIAVHDTVKGLTKTHPQELSPEMHSIPEPKEMDNVPMPGEIHNTPEPSLQPPTFNSKFNEPPPFKQEIQSPQQPGPVPMPSIPFPDLEAPPKKKGLFGRLKR
jgi:hypothetical protein